MMLYCGEGALSETKGVGGRGKRGRGATTVSLLLFSLPPTSSSPQRIVQGFALKRHYFAMLLLLAIPFSFRLLPRIPIWTPPTRGNSTSLIGFLHKPILVLHELTAQSETSLKPSTLEIGSLVVLAYLSPCLKIILIIQKLQNKAQDFECF